MQVSDHLTPEALTCILHARRAAAPLLVHSSVSEVASAGSSVGRMDQMIRAYARDVVPLKRYSDDDPLAVRIGRC